LASQGRGVAEVSRFRLRRAPLDLTAAAFDDEPVLLAYLRKKLRARADEATHEPHRWAAPDFSRFEDALTSAVFARLAYLAPADVWSLLRGSATPLDERPLPARSPEGEPAWELWPRFRVGRDGRNARTVEPDVVVRWGDVVIVFEAKHHGQHTVDQWLEEVAAVRAETGGALWFVAVGGTGPELHALAAAASVSVQGERVSYFRLPWEALAAAARAASRGAVPRATQACLTDLADAIEAWGYREAVWFASLPDAIRGLHVERSAADALPSWSGR